jgi:hypothetical protein
MSAAGLMLTEALAFGAILVLTAIGVVIGIVWVLTKLETLLAELEKENGN